MKNTAFDNVFNLRKAVERMVRTALASGASHSDVHSAISIGCDAGARGFEPAKLQTPKPQIVRRATKAATAVMLLLLSVAGVADARGVLRITTNALPSVIEGASYSTRIRAAGGHRPYTFSIVSGALPNGLSMNSSGFISGTAVGPASQYEFEVQVTDAANPASRAEVIFGHE